jgi:hypothetical protein
MASLAISNTSCTLMFWLSLLELFLLSCSASFNLSSAPLFVLLLSVVPAKEADFYLSFRSSS